MKRRVILLLLLSTGAWADSVPATTSTPSTSAGQKGSGHKGSDWTSVEKALGRPGIAQEEGIQFLFPRTDLNVVVEGYPLDSANVLVSRFDFQPGPEGKTKKAHMEGQVYLLDSEVPEAMAQAVKGGLEVTALYSPFLDASPGLKCLRVKGEGSKSSLAWAAQMVLAATNTPLDAPPAKVTPTVSPTPPAASPRNHDSWGEVQDLLGQGEEKELTLLYKWEEKDRSAALAFQNHGKDTTTFGEISVPPGECRALVEDLLQRRITVTARFTEDSSAPSRGFVDFWAVGERKRLAEDLKEILSQEQFINL
jgi:hypothetical protein